MRRRELFLLLTATALLLAAASWGAAALCQWARSDHSLAVARWGAWEDCVPLSGTVFRAETALSTDKAGAELLVPDQTRVPAGEPLAIVYESGAEYFRAALLLRLRSEAKAGEMPQTQALSDYAAALARREFSALPAAARATGAALGIAPLLSSEELEAEISALEALAEEDLLTAEAPGWFLAAADGWEGVSPASLTPSALRALLEAPEERAGFAALVTGSEWSYCALLQGEAAARFAPGDRVQLRLPDGSECTVRVGSVVTEGQETLVRFRCRERPEAVLGLRKTEMTAILERFEGYLLPAAALTEREGKLFVRRSDLPLGGWVEVELLSLRDGQAVVRAAGLREGMAVVLNP